MVIIMRMDTFSYAKAEACLYEATRWKNRKGIVEVEREGKACIDPTKTHLNITYVKDILMPQKPFQDREYAKENRGQNIAKLHNSVTSSQSRAIMKGERLSKTVGLIATLPRDNPWMEQIDLTDEEYEYMCNKMLENQTEIHMHKDEEMEKRIKEKLRTANFSDEDREKVNAFLLTVLYAWLKEAGIPEEYVLFHSIHWDESFPHIHAQVLPVVEKVYEKDVYSNRIKKDGTRTLLHAAGSKSISFSVERFYAGKYVDESNRVNYPFMENYHKNVIDRMKNFDIPSLKKTKEWTDLFEKYPDLESQIKETANHLLNGATKGKGFSPQNYNREEREERAALIEAHRRVKKDLEKKEIELAKKEAELDEMKIELAEVEEKEKSMKELIHQLKEELALLMKEILLFVPNIVKIFIESWKETTSDAEKKKVEKSAIKKVKKEAEGMYGRLKDFEDAANELMQEDEIISGIKM